MTEMGRYSDDEAAKMLVHQLLYWSQFNRACAILVVAESRPHIKFLMDKVGEREPEVEKNVTLLTLRYHGVSMQFITTNTDASLLSSLQPVEWLALCDTIPASMVNLLNGRASRGYNIWKQNGWQI